MYVHLVTTTTAAATTTSKFSANGVDCGCWDSGGCCCRLSSVQSLHPHISGPSSRPASSSPTMTMMDCCCCNGPRACHQNSQKHHFSSSCECRPSREKSDIVAFTSTLAQTSRYIFFIHTFCASQPQHLLHSEGAIFVVVVDLSSKLFRSSSLDLRACTWCIYQLISWTTLLNGYI